MHPSPDLSIEERIEAIRQTLPSGVRLVAVSKYHSAQDIIIAYEAGQRLFGESRVQELLAKHEALVNICLDINWHFIGPLQTNKVKYIAPFVQMIESVGSLRLLEEINKQALKNARRIAVLLEVHVAQEESKSGFTPEELLQAVDYIYQHAEHFAGIRLAGLMAMASFTDDKEQISREFAQVASLYQQIKTSGRLVDPDYFDELSMGMSGDYLEAIEQGATLVRLGTAIFGEQEELDEL